VESLAPKEFAASICQPLSHDFVDDEEEVHSSGNKEETAADKEDLVRRGKEKVAEVPKTTKKRGNSRRVHGVGGKILDSRRFEAKRRAELDTPPEATATIQMPKSR
jgi:hypothetical protein